MIINLEQSERHLFILSYKVTVFPRIQGGVPVFFHLRQIYYYFNISSKCKLSVPIPLFRQLRSKILNMYISRICLYYISTSCNRSPITNFLFASVNHPATFSIYLTTCAVRRLVLFPSIHRRNSRVRRCK